MGEIKRIRITNTGIIITSFYYGVNEKGVLWMQIAILRIVVWDRINKDIGILY